jgi:hypothetical protein
VARDVARATLTRVVSWGGGGGRRVRVVLLLRDVEPRAVEPLAGARLVVEVLAVLVRPFAGARPDDEARPEEVVRPEAPWREDPDRPLGRGLRFVAVTVPERYQAPPARPGSPLGGDRR